MGSLKINYIFVLVGLSLLLRIVLAFIPGFKVDVEAWFAWAQRLTEMGFANFYSTQVWTNYTPGYLYILYVLGFIKNLFGVSDSFFYFLLKVPAMLGETLLGYLVFIEVKRLLSDKWAYICASLILFNPALIFNSSIWGQVDSLLALAMFISISALLKKRFAASGFFLALAFLIKPQAIAIIPVFILYFLKNFSPRKILNFSIPAILTVLILVFPFFAKSPVSSFLQLFINMVGDYPYTSVFAYNFWGVFGFWAQDSQKIALLSLQDLGTIMFFGYWIILAFFYLKKGIPIFLLGALAVMAFYFLPTRVHDRYLYPALPLIILGYVYIKDKLFFVSMALLNLFYLANLYYVYVYYNEFYYNLPKTLFVAMLYNLIGNFAVLLSFLATVNFILITYIILKRDYGQKTIAA